MRQFAFGILALALVGAPALCRADDEAGDGVGAKLVNLDGPSTIMKGYVGLRGDLRLLQGAEGLDYSSLSVRYGLYNKIEIGFRGTASGMRLTPVGGGGAIRHGGRDAEFYGKIDLGQYGPAHLGLLAGVSLPSTPTQNQAIGTVSATAAVKVHDKVTVVINPKAVLNKGRTLVGIGGGASIRAASNLYVIGDWTSIVAGENSRTLTTGAAVRRNVWGGALRLNSVHNGMPITLDLGYGNSVGSTTGFGLRPGLGSSRGFYASIALRN